MRMDGLFIVDMAVIFLPLLGAFLAGGAALYSEPKWAKKRDLFAQGATCFLMLIVAVLSIWLFARFSESGGARTHIIAPWIETGMLRVSWSLRIDGLSSVVIAVVAVISSMVHLYAVPYMKDDKAVARFMAYLSLFTFFMLVLVSSDNLLQMFFGWEGVGMCSYLLIGYWYQKPTACAAGMKAFWVNRIGDSGFLLGLFFCYALCGSFDFSSLFSAIPQVGEEKSNILALLFFVGAMGKSAQLGLHVWLPDAMEGPTPVSALIHAATMVTAGVFMLARLEPLFAHAPATLAFVAVLGAATALWAALVALTQFDIKRVIAYSTMSQLGYMVFAAGVSAYNAAIFHLATHAFFKALLFLAAGSVIHAMHGEQDMRKMGGLWRKIPYTYVLMWVGCLALSGFGFDGIGGFSGFYSKEMILHEAYARGTWFGVLAYSLGLMAVPLTAFYSWRLLAMTFHGPAHDGSRHVQESSWSMLVPLVPLALGAVFLGAAWHDAFSFAGNDPLGGDALPVQHETEQGALMPFVRIAPSVLAVFGAGLAFWLYTKRPEYPALFASFLGRSYRFVLAKGYIDELYERLFVRPLLKIGDFLWRRIDGTLIDGMGIQGVAAIVDRLGDKARGVQTGFLPHYAFVIVLAIAVMAVWAVSAEWIG